MRLTGEAVFHQAALSQNRQYDEYHGSTSMLTTAKHLTKKIIPLSWRRFVRERFARASIIHLYGPERIEQARNDGIVTCVVKNGAFFINSFIEHYSGLGFRHVFLLDNGSTDDTLAVAARHSNVTAYRCTLPIEAHQGIFKKVLAQKCSGVGWCLDVDVDELFDYPYSDVVTLQHFLTYLNDHDYNAVTVQMLEMFSNRAIGSSAPGTSDCDLKALYQYYDLSNITRYPYRDAALSKLHGANNEVSDDRTALYVGGIRRTLYGHDCLLTKHSLVMPSRVRQLFKHVHFVDGARLADLSCVLLHYKLTSNAVELARQNEVGFPGNRRLYADSVSFLTHSHGTQIARQSARRLGSINELLENNFLFASDAYRDYCVRWLGGALSHSGLSYADQASHGT
jgi:hypothetical protein